MLFLIYISIIQQDVTANCIIKSPIYEYSEGEYIDTSDRQFVYGIFFGDDYSRFSPDYTGHPVPYRIESKGCIINSLTQLDQVRTDFSEPEIFDVLRKALDGKSSSSNFVSVGES